MKMKNRFYSLVLIALFTVFCSSLVSATPKTDMSQTLDELVNAVEKMPGDENRTKRRELMREIIEPRFDFTEMAKRSLGSHWRNINAQEQAEFVSVFSELLANTYISKIDMLERGMVQITEERVHQDKAMIKTMVTYKGDKFGLDYRLLSKSDKWRVYDVIIENIGLVANYRNEFTGVIRKEKFAGLMTRLREKIVTKTE